MATKQRVGGPQLRALLHQRHKIVNDYGLIGNQNKIPFITYRPMSTRPYYSAGWQVITPGFRSDPDGSYHDGFHKTFRVENANVQKKSKLAEAQAWASQNYGVNDWVKTPFGSWTSKEYLDTRLRELLPEFFDSHYSAVKQVSEKLDSDGEQAGKLFRVVVQLYVKPEPPLYIHATDADAALRQVTQLFTRLAGTRVLDGLKLHVYDA